MLSLYLDRPLLRGVILHEGMGEQIFAKVEVRFVIFGVKIEGTGGAEIFGIEWEVGDYPFRGSAR